MNKKPSFISESKTNIKKSIIMEKEISEKEEFSENIREEEFFVKTTDEEEEAIEFETAPRVSIMVPEKTVKVEDEEHFEIGDNVSTKSEPEEFEVKKGKQGAEEPEGDFFEQGVDEDAEKKQIVEEIAGMTEQSEHKEEDQSDVHEVSVKEQIASRRSTIQFKGSDEVIETKDFPETDKDDEAKLEKGASKTSIEQRMSGRRRSSTLPDLMRLSKKSLEALTVMSEGKKSVELAKKSEGASVIDSTADLYGEAPQTKSIQAATPSDMSRRSTRRSTMAGFAYNELGPRYREINDEDLLQGFELGGDEPFHLNEIVEEEEETIKEEEEKQEALERAPFYERHDEAIQEIRTRKMRSFLLQKKLSMYFKRKKMDYVIKETDWSFDAQHRYYRKLEAYGELCTFVVMEKERITTEVEDIKRQKISKSDELKIMFKKMQDREGEIGYGLINTKTGNAIPEKFVERLIRRQNNQMVQVSSMRLTFIRLKGMVQEKLDAIAALDEIAPGFLLADYEQLKSDNRQYSDKIEEKDEELTRLRNKCGSTIQVLAHLREKTTALDNDLEDLQDDLDALDETYFKVRTNLNKRKVFRDNIRQVINKMRDESGLLTQPTLLKDMEKELTEIKVLSDQLEHVMKEHKKKAHQIKTIRKKIEQTVDFRRTLSGKSLTRLRSTMLRNDVQKSKSCLVLYKGRPSLIMPVIEDSAFRSLTTIKPKITYDRSRRNCPKIKHSKRKEG